MSDQRDFLTGLNGEAQVVQDRCAILVGKGDIVKDDIAPDRWHCRCIATVCNGGNLIQCFENALGGDHCNANLLKISDQDLNGIGQAVRIGEKGEDGPIGEVAYNDFSEEVQSYQSIFYIGKQAAIARHFSFDDTHKKQAHRGAIPFDGEIDVSLYFVPAPTKRLYDGCPGNAFLKPGVACLPSLSYAAVKSALYGCDLLGDQSIRDRVNQNDQRDAPVQPGGEDEDEDELIDRAQCRWQDVRNHTHDGSRICAGAIHVLANTATLVEGHGETLEVGEEVGFEG